MTDDRPSVPLEQAARQLGTDPATVGQWISRGWLEAAAGGVTRASLARALRARQRQQLLAGRGGAPILLEPHPGTGPRR